MEASQTVALITNNHICFYVNLCDLTLKKKTPKHLGMRGEAWYIAPDCERDSMTEIIEATFNIKHVSETWVYALYIKTYYVMTHKCCAHTYTRSVLVVKDPLTVYFNDAK